MTEPFRVFSGWDRRQVEAAEVFKFSVEQNSSIEVDVRFLQIDKLPIDRHGVTDFTYSRFLVPWLCGFEGRAVFADGCDQLCLGDVAELAAWDMQGKPLWVVKHPASRKVPLQRLRSWTSLMLMDCAKCAAWNLSTVEKATDNALMRLMSFVDDAIGDLPAEWNALAAQIDVTRKCDPAPQIAEGFQAVAPLKLAHWSYLSDPSFGSWIDRSGSALWAEWRERWRAARSGKAA